MIIETSDKVQLFRYLSHDEFPFSGTPSMSYTRNPPKPISKCIINQRSSFEEPVTLAFNIVEDNSGTFNRIEEWFITCDSIVIVCASKKIAEELFGYIATVMEFGDVPSKAIDDLFIF